MPDHEAQGAGFDSGATGHELQGRSPAPQPEPETETVSTHERLRAFEEKHLPPESEHHPRPHGKIERGSGSIFAGLHPAHKAHHAALEALIAAETKHQQASVAEDAAHAELEAAVARAAATEEASEAELNDDEPEPQPETATEGQAS